jgi:peroxiredoxin
MIDVGDTAPAFELADASGAQVSLPEGAPAVLVFYRGDW